jgi:hypothetical protein
MKLKYERKFYLEGRWSRNFRRSEREAKRRRLTCDKEYAWFYDVVQLPRNYLILSLAAFISTVLGSSCFEFRSLLEYLSQFCVLRANLK